MQIWIYVFCYWSNTKYEFNFSACLRWAWRHQLFIIVHGTWTQAAERALVRRHPDKQYNRGEPVREESAGNRSEWALISSEGRRWTTVGREVPLEIKNKSRPMSLAYNLIRIAERHTQAHVGRVWFGLPQSGARAINQTWELTLNF